MKFWSKIESRTYKESQIHLIHYHSGLTNKIVKPLTQTCPNLVFLDYICCKLSSRLLHGFRAWRSYKILFKGPKFWPSFRFVSFTILSPKSQFPTRAKSENPLAPFGSCSALSFSTCELKYRWKKISFFLFCWAEKKKN